MSEEAGLRHKLNKKLKIAMAKPKNYIYRDETKTSAEKGGGYKSRKRTTNRNRHGVTEGSDDGDVHFEEKHTKLLNYGRRRNRIDTYPLMSYKNVDATNKKASYMKHQKMVKVDLDKGEKSNYKAIRSVWISPILKDATSTSKSHFL
ncbi:hypothetical protein REPUB_Repub11eG0196400 [Reevesia pubescens]